MIRVTEAEVSGVRPKTSEKTDVRESRRRREIAGSIRKLKEKDEEVVRVCWKKYHVSMGKPLNFSSICLLYTVCFALHCI